jgi:hypothetical protein
MDAKLATWALGVFVVGIFLFVGTFSWFMLFKERVCAQSLFTVSCGEQYPAFMHNELLHL